jgi:hypothetical protein
VNSRTAKTYVLCIGLALFLHTYASTGQELQGSGSQTDTEQANMCQVRGTVVKSTTGQPVNKVWVTLRPAGWQGREHSTASDSQGQFVLRGVEPGLYFLDAQGAGFPSQRYSEPTSNDRQKLLSLKSQGEIGNILFRLVPAGVITGTIYNEEGDPIAGAHVAALGRNRGRVSVIVEGETNDHGEYRLFWLAPGRYYVVASNLNESKTGVYLPTYYPNVSQLDQATLVQTLPDVETSGINIRSVRARGVRVTGQILSLVKENSVQGIFVQLIPRDASIPGYFYEGRFGAPTDAKGNFEFRSVPPAAYILYANLNQPHRGYSGHVEVSVGDADVSGISLLLNPNVDLTVRIRIDPGEKIDLTRLRIWLKPRENLLWPPIETESKPDGTFTLTQVRAGNYRVHVEGYPEGFYLKSARIGDVDVLVSGLNVDGGRTAETLELELSRNGGRIDGTVVHELKPAAGALVVLVPNPPQQGRDDLYIQKTADLLARFSFLGVPPGYFRLFAWEDAEDSRINDPEFLKAYESLGKQLHIQEKQSQTVQLELIPVPGLH